MHTTINYANSTPRDAVLDAVEYLGYRRTRLLVSEAKRLVNYGTSGYEQWTNLMAFAGVEGYPVKAMWIWAIYNKALWETLAYKPVCEI